MFGDLLREKSAEVIGSLLGSEAAGDFLSKLSS
jgi:hypothetical protein